MPATFTAQRVGTDEKMTSIHTHTGSGGKSWESKEYEHTVRETDFLFYSNLMKHEWAYKWVRSIRFNEKYQHNHITPTRKVTEIHFSECTLLGITHVSLNQNTI